MDLCALSLKDLPPAAPKARAAVNGGRGQPNDGDRRTPIFQALESEWNLQCGAGGMDQISGAFSSTAGTGRKGVSGNIKAQRGAAAGRGPSEGAAGDGRAEGGTGLWRAVIAAVSAGRPRVTILNPPQKGVPIVNLLPRQGCQRAVAGPSSEIASRRSQGPQCGV